MIAEERWRVDLRGNGKDPYFFLIMFPTGWRENTFHLLIIYKELPRGMPGE